MIPLSKVKKTCRICGKEYTPCSYCENDRMAFHYRTICCSRECAQKYLAKVLEARSATKDNACECPNDTPVENVVTKEECESKQEETTVDTEDTVEDVTEQPVKRKYVRRRQTDADKSMQIE